MSELSLEKLNICIKKRCGIFYLNMFSFLNLIRILCRNCAYHVFDFPIINFHYTIPLFDQKNKYSLKTMWADNKHRAGSPSVLTICSIVQSRAQSGGGSV